MNYVIYIYDKILFENFVSFECVLALLVNFVL